MEISEKKGKKMGKICVWMRCEERQFSAETSSSSPSLLSPFVDSAEEGRYNKYPKKLGGNIEKMKKRHIASTVMVAMIVLAAFSMPVSAPGNPGAGCTSETKFYGTIHGGIYFEQHGWRNGPAFTTTFDNVPDGTIKIAKVYTGVWGGSPGKGGKFNITVNGVTSPTYQACDPCPDKPCAAYQSLRCDALNWSGNSPPNVPSGDIHDYVVGCGVHFISYNATSFIHPGSNTVTVRASCCDNCTCWYSDDIYLIALLVVYEDSSMPEITYWINEGAPYIEKGSFCDGPDDHLYASKYFNGMHVSNPTRVKLWSLGWPHVINATLSPAYTRLNGNNIGYPDITESHFCFPVTCEVLLRWNNISTDYLDSSSNFLEYYDPEPHYERAFAEVLIVQRGEPDLVIADKWVCWPDNCTICYNVTNIGTGTAPACHNTQRYMLMVWRLRMIMYPWTWRPERAILAVSMTIHGHTRHQAAT